MTGRIFALIGASGYIAPRHMNAIKETNNELVATLNYYNGISIIDSYFPKTDFFIKFERFRGYNSEIILAGRWLNDNMGIYVVSQVIKSMIKKGQKIEGSKVLVMGITFKENCPDIRNSRVIDVIKELQEYGCNVDVTDPWADTEEVEREYNIKLIANGKSEMENYDGIVLAVTHDEFKEFNSQLSIIHSQLNKVVYDIKGFFDKNMVDGRL